MKRELSCKLPPRRRGDHPPVEPVVPSLNLHDNQWHELVDLARRAGMLPMLGQGLPRDPFIYREAGAVTATECRAALHSYRVVERDLVVPAHLAPDWYRFLNLLLWGQLHSLEMR